MRRNRNKPSAPEGKKRRSGKEKERKIKKERQRRRKKEKQKREREKKKRERESKRKKLLKDLLADVSYGRELQIKLLKGCTITYPSPVDDSSTHLTSRALRCW